MSEITEYNGCVVAKIEADHTDVVIHFTDGRALKLKAMTEFPDATPVMDIEVD